MFCAAAAWTLFKFVSIVNGTRRTDKFSLVKSALCRFLDRFIILSWTSWLAFMNRIMTYFVMPQQVLHCTKSFPSLSGDCCWRSLHCQANHLTPGRHAHQDNWSILIDIYRRMNFSISFRFMNVLKWSHVIRKKIVECESALYVRNPGTVAFMLILHSTVKYHT